MGAFRDGDARAIRGVQMTPLLHAELIRTRHHNLRLRRVLMCSMVYGALATMAALWGWLR